jgi:hypothetical protein
MGPALLIAKFFRCTISATCVAALHKNPAAMIVMAQTACGPSAEVASAQTDAEIRAGDFLLKRARSPADGLGDAVGEGRI